MHKSFDKILTNKIIDSFENHQEPFNPDDWKKMKEKLAKEKKQKIIWLPKFAKAAVIFILFGVTALLFYAIGRYNFDKTNIYCKKINSKSEKITNRPIFINRSTLFIPLHYFPSLFQFFLANKNAFVSVSS